MDALPPDDNRAMVLMLMMLDSSGSLGAAAYPHGVLAVVHCSGAGNFCCVRKGKAKQVTAINTNHMPEHDDWHPLASAVG